jgi:hypothetical protein
VLDAVSQLPQDLLGDVQRILGDKIDPHPFGADQPHHLLDLFLQGLGDVFEKEVGFVKEEDQLRLFRIPHLGELLEQFRQHPEQQRGIDLGRLHEFVGGQDIDHPPAAALRLNKILDIQGRFP